MIKVALPTQAEIKEVLHYAPETGVFRWRHARAKGSVKPWSVAGASLNGYRQISLKNKIHRSHRLAWVYMTGEWPEHQVDHINGCKSDNRWANLRGATHKQNQENLSLTIVNKSGFRGVSWCKTKNLWRAVVGHNKKIIHIGYFVTAEEAGQAAAAKRAGLFTHDTGRSFKTTEESK